MICFYHNADLDGLASAAIVYKRYSCQFYGLNYGDRFPWDYLKDNERVIMVDFCLQPFDYMVKLASKFPLTWIDHHKTSIEANEKTPLDAHVILNNEFAACELAWMYFFDNLVMPQGVRMLGRYDVWDLAAHPDVLPFQFGMRVYGALDPNSDIWHLLLDGSPMFYSDTVKEGNIVLKYRKSENEKLIKGYSIHTEFEGHSAIAINAGGTSSQMFEGVNEDQFPLWITFVRTRNKNWSVSLYSKSIDVSHIAKKYKGGGHRGAAGFQCKKLPFEV